MKLKAIFGTMLDDEALKLKLVWSKTMNIQVVHRCSGTNKFRNMLLLVTYISIHLCVEIFEVI
jgi:hypothetical protein